MTIYINNDLIVVSSKGTSWSYLGYTLTEALKLFRKEQSINNKRVKRWIY